MIKKRKKILVFLFSLLLFIGISFFIELRDHESVRVLEGKYPPFRVITGISRITTDTILAGLYIFHRPEIPRYELHIQEKEFEKMMADLPNDDTILMDANYGQAKLSYQGKVYDVRVRVRGDSLTHAFNSKRSYKVKLPEGEKINGEDVLNFITAGDRGYVNASIVSWIAEKNGLITPKSELVLLRENGSPDGLYYRFQDWGEAVLEQNNKIKGPIFGESDLTWDTAYPIHPFANHLYWKNYVMKGKEQYDVDLSPIKRLIKSMELSNDAFAKEIPTIIDMHALYEWLTVAVLMGQFHSGVNNHRFYLNPTTGKLEPIVWDQQGGQLAGRNWNYVLFAENPLVLRILSIPRYQHQFHQTVWKNINDDAFLESILMEYDRIVQFISGSLSRDFLKSKSTFRALHEIKERRAAFLENWKTYKKDLQYSHLFIEYVKSRGQEEQKVIPLLFFSDGFSGVRLTSLEVEGFSSSNDLRLFQDSNGSGEFEREDELVGAFRKEDGRWLLEDLDMLFKTNRNEDFSLNPRSERFFLVSEKAVDFTQFSLSADTRNDVTGETTIPDIRYREVDNFSSSASVRTAKEMVEMNNNMRIVLEDEQTARVLPGDYMLPSSLVVPRAVTFVISPGTNFHFAKGSGILSYGRIEARGTKDAPIRFMPAMAGNTWGSVAIVGNEGEGRQENIFIHTIFEKGGRMKIGGFTFTGMLSGDHTSLVIRDSEFKESAGDDAVNVRYGTLTVEHSIFVKNGSDGIDSDFSQVIIDRSTFVGNGTQGIGGDAIDLAGSSGRIFHNDISASEDKGISIGEHSSDVILFDNMILENATGVAIKDYSEVVLLNNTISKNKEGVVTFVKKEFYVPRPAKVKIVNTIIRENETPMSLYRTEDVYLSHILTENSRVSDFEEEGDREELRSYGIGDFDRVPIGAMR